MDERIVDLNTTATTQQLTRQEGVNALRVCESFPQTTRCDAAPKNFANRTNQRAAACGLLVRPPPKRLV